MIIGSLFGIWLVVAVVVFSLLFDPDDWGWAVGLSVMWPVVMVILFNASLPGLVTEARELWDQRRRRQ
jgi:hypothetical protein